MTQLRRATQLSPLALEPNGPSVVAIGGGHGLATVLEAALGYASEVAGIVTALSGPLSVKRFASSARMPDSRIALVSSST